MNSILGRKVGMTQIYTQEGEVIPVTVIEAGPCVVVDKRTISRDGYNAISIGFEPVKEKHTTRPYRGQFKDGMQLRKFIREVRTDDIGSYNVGDEIRATIFHPGDAVDVIGTSKGKGFQGVVRRHGFRGGRETHGSNFHRRPGSIGQSADPSRVYPGTRMPGRMGGARVTVQNLDVVQIDDKKNLVMIKGAVPGTKGSLVTIRKRPVVGEKA